MNEEIAAREPGECGRQQGAGSERRGVQRFAEKHGAASVLGVAPERKLLRVTAVEQAGADAWESILDKLPAGRVKDKLESATFLNLTNTELVVAGPASLAAIAPAAGKQLSEALGRPIKLVRRSS